MKTRKKRIPAFFQVYENDALKQYLEHMAASGWKLTRVSSMFLHFEACSPRRIRYCVEVMEKPSAYASNQTEKLKTYRDFCRDAGWEYVGATGYLHIFYTEDENAVAVETDSQERYQRICQACRGSVFLFTVIFGLTAGMNLYSCYVNGTIFCMNGWVAMLLAVVLVWYAGEYFLWKRQAVKTLEESGTLPCPSWRFLLKKNVGIVILALLISAVPLVYTLSQPFWPGIFWILLGLWFYIVLLAVVFTKVLYWLREKRTYNNVTNMILYWGIALVIGAVTCGIFLALVFWLI